MTPQTVSIIGGVFGALAIILGAFGAHALKKHFTADLMQSFETGVKYQMYHATILVILGFNLNLETTLERATVWCFFIGIILFSFSIYGLCITALRGKKLKFLGPLTPLGGLLLLLGWILLIIGFV